MNMKELFHTGIHCPGPEVLCSMRSYPTGSASATIRREFGAIVYCGTRSPSIKTRCATGDEGTGLKGMGAYGQTQKNKPGWSIGSSFKIITLPFTRAFRKVCRRTQKDYILQKNNQRNRVSQEFEVQKM
jgi:hypothetical protein